MKSRLLRPRRLAAAVAAVVAVAGFGADPSQAASPLAISDSPARNIDAIGINSTQSTARYIVRFAEPPVAQYNALVASKGVPSIPLKAAKNGRMRLDVHSAQAQNYVSFLKTQQQQHVGAISAALGRAVPAGYSMQHALNATILELSTREVDKVAKVPGVVAVERDRPHALATDLGPGFIGASSVWWNMPAGQDTVFAGGFDNAGGFFGDGMVVGDIDTGYNSLSPSFQPTDENGYTVSNPLGSGHFLGQCNIPMISAAGCNDKVIGVYDEISLTGSGGVFSGYSVEDTQGHGSHTASTAAGNYRIASISGYSHAISGVAPHANLVIYFACSPDPAVRCSAAATTASVDHAIQDGVVDALNYSISGGIDPWNESTSLAFLSAENAGIFVATSAGNISASVPSQVNFTVNHWEPWVTTVAASTHTGGPLSTTLAITGTAPPTVTAIANISGNQYAGFDANVSESPVKLSPAFHNNDTSGEDGCSSVLEAGNGYAVSTFAGSIAVISRGGCFFGDKALSAQNAGAVAVIISDNRAEDLAQVGFTLDDAATRFSPHINIPVTFISQADGTALATYLGANTVTASVPIPFARLAIKSDELANFSLLGPAGINVVKPDVQAPGVDILAAVANDGTANGADAVAFFNGTSMAAPHTTGSGILLMGTHPEWSPAQAKSALMLTAKEAGLTKANGVSPSNMFDHGAGRIQDFQAINTGLTLDEDALDFAVADPALGGDPTSLNLASMQNFACINSCSFSRTFTSSAASQVTWTPSFTGSFAGRITPSSPTFTLNPGASVLFGVTIDTASLGANNAILLGEMTLTPSDTSLQALHVPISIVVPAPAILAEPNPLSITGVGATSASATLNVSNIGGGTLNVAQTTSGSANYAWITQQTPFNNGYTSTQFAAREAGATDYFASDDFIITGSSVANLSAIYVPGFAQPNGLTSFGANLPLHWRIYSDAGGKPSGNPEDGSQALWSFDSTAGGDGVYVAQGPYPDDIYLDLVGAGAPPTNLPAGHYWLVVYPTFPCLGAGKGCTTGQWYWLTSSNGSGNSAVSIAPQMVRPSWDPIDPSTGKGLAMELDSTVGCAPAPWLSQTGLPALIPALATVPVTVRATSPLGASSVTAYLCLQSNDPSSPTAIQVNAAQ